MKIPFVFTYKSILQAKLLNWFRRSVLKYAVCTIMIGFAIPLIQNSQQSFFNWKAALLLFAILIFFSIVAILTSSHIIYKKITNEDKVQLNLIFTEDGINVEGATGKKEWSWIVDYKIYPDFLYFRVNEGLFNKAYFLVRRAEIPADYFEKLCDLLSERVSKNRRP